LRLRAICQKATLIWVYGHLIPLGQFPPGVGHVPPPVLNEIMNMSMKIARNQNSYAMFIANSYKIILRLEVVTKATAQ